MIDRARVTNSAAWRAIEMAGSEGLSFLIFVVTARLLVPEEFGVVAIAGAILQVGAVLLHRGLPDALIQAVRLDDDQVRSALTLSILGGAAMAAVIILLAWPVGWLMGRDHFPPIMAALAPVLVIQGATLPLHAILRRRFEFRQIAVRTLGATALGGLAAIYLAGQGAGSWALVAQQWVASLVGALLIFRFSPVRPWPLRLSRDALEPLLAVARPVLVGGFLMQSTRRLDAVALGLFVTDHEVGLYFLVARLVLSVQLVTTYSIGELGLVVLSRLQSDPHRLAAAIRRAFRLTAYACLLCFGGLVVTAGFLVPLLFGPEWADAVLPLQVLAALSAFGALATVGNQALVAIGAATDAGRLSARSSVLQVIAIFGGAALGLMPMVIALGAVQAVMLWPTILRICAHTRVAPMDFMRDLAPILGGWTLALAAGWGATRAPWSGVVMELLPGVAFGVVMLACGLRWRHTLFGRLG
jgi:O-antigen/teichoic acid export membrane protein